MTLFLMLAACISEPDPFGPGGQYNKPPDSLSLGDSGDTGGEASVIPRIAAIRADFADYPNIGDVIEVGLVIVDKDEDTEGGLIALTIENTTWGIVQAEIEVDGISAYVEDGEVIFAIANVNTAETYDLSVKFTDVAGNESQKQTATVE